MKIHEYQGKALLKEFGVPVPRGIVARTPEEAEAAARELGTDVVVVKAQIHAGGRGKGGGVKLAKSPEEAKQIASDMLGMMLVTHQTGPEGREVKTLLIEDAIRFGRTAVDFMRGDEAYKYDLGGKDLRVWRAVLTR